MITNKTIKDLLSPIAPTFWSVKDQESTATTYIVYSWINQSGRTFADNDEKITSLLLQVDVYSKGSVDAMVRDVKSRLRGIGFWRTSEIPLYNETTKTVRCSLTLKGINKN
jgi:hypothetical protein